MGISCAAVLRALSAASLGVVVALAGCGSSTSNDAGSDAGGGRIGRDASGACTSSSQVFANAVTCSGNVATACMGDGGAPVVTDCAASGKTCMAGAGCMACTPGAASCKDGQAKVCRSDGSAVVEFVCDPVQGMTCDPDGCHGVCATAAAAASYIGCDYYPTVTLNPVWSGFTFAAAVANAGEQIADITVTRGPSTIAQTSIMPHSLATIPLPWVPELKGGDADACQKTPEPGATRLVTQGAYRLRSTGPVTVYQFSPLEYELSPAPSGCPVASQCGGPVSDCLSYTNDASLLLPAPALTGDYTVLTWASTPTDAALLAVTATQDNTVVQLVPQGQFAAGAGIDATGKGTVTLGAGDVLEVVATHAAASGYGSDLSGTRVHASQPVQVIAGHSCANVPTAATGYCDHLEQSMFPDEVLGKDYLVTFPSAEVGDSPHEIRISASTAQAHIHFDPPIAGDAVLDPSSPPLTLQDVTKDVRITSDQPILVAQVMPGSTSLPVPVGSGDPSLSMGIPTAQFRDSYIFVASHTYYVNFVNVIAPAGTTVTLDGAAIASSEFTAIGSSGFSVARHQLAQVDNHDISSPVPFGIVVYGYGKQTSYMYPGGLDLRALNPAPAPPK